MPIYALKEEISSKRENCDVWYRFWTQIGPACTRKPEERALFTSKEQAMASQAYIFPAAFFEPVELPDGAPGDLNWNKTVE